MTAQIASSFPLICKAVSQEANTYKDSTTTTTDVLGFKDTSTSWPSNVWRSIRNNGLYLLIFTATVITILITLTIYFASKHGCERSKEICMECTKLMDLVDRWAWPNNVKQDGDHCCFEEEADLLHSMKFYFEKKMTGDKNEIGQLQTRVNGIIWMLENNGTKNGTVLPTVEFSKLTDLIKEVFHRQRSILHLVSSRVELSTPDPRIVWDDRVKQGNISYFAQRQSVKIKATALYYVTTQLKFQANITTNNVTENTTVQFFLKKMYHNQGHHSEIESYTKYLVFHDKMTEHDATLQTITRLDLGDELFIHIPSSQRKYLSLTPGSHRLSIFELS